MTQGGSLQTLTVEKLLYPEKGGRWLLRLERGGGVSQPFGKELSQEVGEPEHPHTFETVFLSLTTR